MAQKGLDPSKLVISNVAPPARASALLAGQVPAIEFFVMARPGLEPGAKDAKAELRTLLLSDEGLESLFQRHCGDRGLHRQEPRRGEAVRPRRP